MRTKTAPLSETFLADFALVRFFTSMSSPMFNQILPGAERLATKLTNLRFLASVYPNMSLHVLPSDQLATHFTCHLILAGVRPHVLLVAIAVDCLEAAYLALEFLPRLGLTMNHLHVITEVDSIAEGLVADLAGAGLVVGVRGHVSLQRCLQVKALVTNLAELGKLLVMPPDVKPQIVIRRQLRAAHVTNVRCAV